MAQSSALNLNKYNFLYSFRPVYYFSRVFGFMPFTMVCGSNGTIQGPAVRLLDIFWFLISICLYISSALLSFQNAQFPKNFDNTESLILITADYFILLSGLAFGVVVIVMDMFNRYKFVEILQNINTFDAEVQ